MPLCKNKHTIYTSAPVIHTENILICTKSWKMNCLNKLVADSEKQCTETVVSSSTLLTGQSYVQVMLHNLQRHSLRVCVSTRFLPFFAWNGPHVGACSVFVTRPLCSSALRNACFPWRVDPSRCREIDTDLRHISRRLLSKISPIQKVRHCLKCIVFLL